MDCSGVFVLVYPNGYINDTIDGTTSQSSEPLLMNIDIGHQESLLELKNLILTNMGELGRKQISQVAYRLHITIGPQASDTRIFWLKSNQHVQLMFGYHGSNPELRCIELYVKVEDLVISSASAEANPQVVELENIGKGAKRAQSPVISPSFAFSNRLENAEAVDGKRSNFCARPVNVASEGVSWGKLCLPPKTRDIGGASFGFAPPTSKQPSFVDTSVDLGLPPPLKLQKVAGGKGKPVETGVLDPEREESSLYSKNFQGRGMCGYLEPPITSNSQKVLEDRVKDLEIRLESKENERAALEDLKITLTSRVCDLENQLKEAEKELDRVNSWLVKAKKTAVASDARVKQLKAEVKHLRRSLKKGKDATHRNIMEQVRSPGIDFSCVCHDHCIVNGQIVDPYAKKNDAPQISWVPPFPPPNNNSLINLSYVVHSYFAPRKDLTGEGIEKSATRKRGELSNINNGEDAAGYSCMHRKQKMVPNDEAKSS